MNSNNKKIIVIVIAAVIALVVGATIAVVSFFFAEEPTTDGTTEATTSATTECVHEYVETTVERTKENDGYVLHQCTKCGYKYKTNYAYATGSEGLKYTLATNDKDLLITGLGTCTDEEIIIPAYHEGKKVLWIAEESFKNCTSIKSVKILGKLDRMGTLVFAGCSSLEDIYYAGTKAEWEAMPKGDKWDVDTPNYTVHCSDGDITKQ